ncbi:GbsR/MarR family transcriptional regulator [Paenibacillus aquistagni]|uniref:HTH-type transcriptional regulator n=1 Tax=Paenibacillus aquistagni TaxID=1852522 RepID=A0A1X7K6U8_9BACL|nr:GbsR/MarR family transcriptional regulator [Paenibacillus aquistagni]NMM54032.1 GbsR/MarR family transcriptional regulator [Paenibacillus aquistagni]SMG35995.1 DNA-binding transcriptional regulator GbsR, MarR family [Paenibacillus aquistagni]
MDKLEMLSSEQQAVIEKARKRVIESIGVNMNLYGITPSIGHLYGIMFFSGHPMTLDEMGTEMGMSKTSMSTGVRTLIDLKMVHKVWERGTRKDLYEVEEDWHQTFIDFFSIQWRKAVDMNLSHIQRSLRDLTALSTAHPEDEALQIICDKDIAKLRSAESYYMWLNRVIDGMEQGDIFDWVPKQPES